MRALVVRITLAALCTTGCDAVYDLRGRGDANIDTVDARPACREASDPQFHDEDSDGFDDACDTCPTQFSDAMLSDEDGDGVGDSCDPRPTIAGDRIWFFDGFGPQRRLDQGWTSTGGDWHITNDALVFSEVVDTSYYLLQSMMPPPPQTPFVVEASFDLVTTPDFEQSSFEVVTEINSGFTKAIGCGFMQDDTNAKHVSLVNDYREEYLEVPTGHPAGNTFTIRFSYAPLDTSVCYVESLPDIHHQVTAPFPPPADVPQPWGLLAHQMSVRVRWVAVYSRE